MSHLNVLRQVPLMKLVLIAVLATGVLASAAGRGSLAYFTSTVVSNTNTFTAGDLHFSIDDDSGHSATSTHASNSVSISTTMSLANMKPGDVVLAPLHLTNLGSVDAKWGISYTTTTTGSVGNLAPALTLAVVGRGSGTGAANNTSCTGANYSDSTIWKERILETPEAMTNSGRTIVDYTWTAAPTSDGTYANTEAGASHYLHMHPSKTATNTATSDALEDDVLCVRVAFPNDVTNNNWNGDTPLDYETTIAFTFVAEQAVLSTETPV